MLTELIDTLSVEGTDEQATPGKVLECIARHLNADAGFWGNEGQRGC
jgi:hypothetical protein